MEHIKLFVIMRVMVMFWIMVANALYVRKLNRREHFALRSSLTIIISLVLCVVLGAVCYFILSAYVDGGNKSSGLYPILNVISHYLIYGISIAGLFVCFKEKPVTILFCSIAGYISENIANSVNNAIATCLGFSSVSSLYGGDLTAIALYFCYYIVVYAILYFLFARSIDNVSEVAEMNRMPTLILFLGVSVVAIAVRSYAAYFSRDVESLILFELISISNICCCLIMLYVQFLLSKQLYKKKEDDMLLKISEQRLQQYEFAKENIDIINIKCHDLKHQLLAIKNEGKVDGDYIKKLSDSISFYDSIVSTGNDAFDTVISDKNLYCAKNEIKLTCMVDGNKLAFMKASDIYSLFGNALDNAIEYVMRLPPEKRIIKIAVSEKDDLIGISIANYYEGQLKLIHGLPPTTKSDTSYHGFGMKSIRNTAEIYGGNLMVTAEHNMFTLGILIPKSRKV